MNLKTSMTDTGSGASNLLRAPRARGRSGKKSAKNKRTLFSARRVAIFLLLLLVAAAGGLGLVSSTSPGKIVPGVTVNMVSVGDLTPDEARQVLERRIADMRLPFVHREQRHSLPVNTPARAGGRPLAVFDVETAVIRAFEIGHGGDGLAATAQKIDAYVFGTDIKIPTELDLAELQAVLGEKFPELNQPARDADLAILLDGAGGRPQVTVRPEQNGQTVDLDAAARETAYRLKTFSAAAIPLRVRKDLPRLTRDDVEPLTAAAAAAVDRAPLTLKAKDISWSVSDRQLADWIVAVPAEKPLSGARLSFDPQEINKYLGSRAAALRLEPVDAVFTMTDGKVTEFRPSSDGEEVDIEAAATLLATVIFGPSEEDALRSLELPFRKIPPQVDTASANPYGIKEIIGVGESNFRGSPRNRRSNIAVGAGSVNGTIIEPDEEFSLMKTLGNIDGSQGYLKELVIKENKTIPEYGGGLCQIGTTTFRAALASGLPITERRNHSYRVPYYERDGDGKPMGPGKDATIYDPWPDFKFINDTGNAILILTDIDGDRLTFTFWGVRDGRVAEQTVAKVYNIVPAPEKTIIETTDLKPGETKCTESPHAGADAVFTYTVTYPDGEIKEKDFFSHYRPWGEVCLLGVDPDAEPAAGTAPDLPSADVVGASGN